MRAQARGMSAEQHRHTRTHTHTHTHTQTQTHTQTNKHTQRPTWGAILPEKDFCVVDFVLVRNELHHALIHLCEFARGVERHATTFFHLNTHMCVSE